MKNRLIGAILSLLGFGAAACSEDGQVVMYGLPPVVDPIDFVVAGEVVNALGSAIPGILVTEVDNYGGVAIMTEVDGSFSFHSNCNEDDVPFTKTLLFEDADGPMNGVFENKEVTFTFTEEERITEESGTFEQTDVKVVLSGE
jgi:putative lipoprotein (rSAM/lipoprotein system)